MKKRTSILKRLILLFVVLVIPIILTGIMMQVYTNRQFQENILTNIGSMITSRIENIDNTIQYTNQNAFDILNSGRARRLSNPKDPMSPYDRSHNVNYIRDLMENLKYSNPYISNVRMYFPALSVYYNVGYIENQGYQANKSQGEMTEALYQQLLSLREASPNPYIINDSLVFLQYSSIRNPRIIVEAVYNRTSLNGMFQQTLMYDDARYLFRLNGSVFSISNCTEDALLQLSTSDLPASIRMDGQRWYVFPVSTQTMNGVYIQLIPARHLSSISQASTHYSVIFTTIVLLFLSIFVAVAFRIVHAPVNLLSDSLNKIEGGNLNVQMALPEVSDFDYVYQCFNRMSSRLSTLVQQQLEHEKLLNRAQLKQLQAQINPHFLYNTFFILNMMIEREMNDEASELARELGFYFRYITRNDSDTATLQDEYEHTRVYADIQSKRFYGKVKIQVEELPSDFSQLVVPRLILQPVLENAFNYGMEEKIRDGFLRFGFAADEASVSVIIEDNGDCLSDEKLASMQENLQRLISGSFDQEYTGLYNLCKRLLLYYGQEDVMQFSRSELGGLKIQIKLYKKEDGADVSSNDH